MAKESKLEGTIPKLYKRNALHLLLYGYVTGVRSTLHTIDIPMAISMFIEDFNIDPEDINEESAKVIYGRMRKEFLNL